MNYEIRRVSSPRSSTTWPSATRRSQVAATLDALKEAGFHWATRSGVTIAIDDVITPPRKREILGEYESEAERIEKQYQRGLITDEERRGELIEIWTKATNEVAKEMAPAYPADNPVWIMVNSGARGNMIQVRQIAGMRGLVANPKGEIIPRPIKSSFREGLSVLEYFISTHGARKGLADTALRTADSGYLTRRLVDVSQDVIIREEDCGTDRGDPDAGRRARRGRHARRCTSTPRPACTPVRWRTTSSDADGTVVVPRGADLNSILRRHAVAAGVEHGPGAQRADLRVEARRLRGLLRPFAADRQDGRHRRGGRHHRRPVHR